MGIKSTKYYSSSPTIVIGLLMLSVLIIIYSMPSESAFLSLASLIINVAEPPVGFVMGSTDSNCTFGLLSMHPLICAIIFCGLSALTSSLMESPSSVSFGLEDRLRNSVRELIFHTVFWSMHLGLPCVHSDKPHHVVYR